MNSARSVAPYCLLLVLSLAFAGCGKKEQAAPSKPDENKPIAEAKAEAEKMDNETLKATAMGYKDAITAKTTDVEKVADKLKALPVSEMLGDEAKAIKSEMDSLNESISALQARFAVYYDKLKEKGGDLSGFDE